MRSFGHLEREVMRVVWEERRPLTGHEIAERLSHSRKIAYTTLITVIERLRAKGILTRFRDGRSYRYQAATSEETYAAQLMSEVLEGSADRPRALLAFAGRLDPHEAAALRAALDRASQEATGRVAEPRSGQVDGTEVTE